MKEAKQKFDSLMERIRDGEQINFGQMERVYAQAFLGKFLERLITEPSRRKMDQMYGNLLEHDNLADAYYDEQGEEVHLSDSQTNQYSLELISMMSGVLGIRATTQQLSPFIESALRHRDWELLEKTLALSEEGKMSKGVIEKIALEQLVNDRTDSYDELRQRFGEIQFNPEEVREAYKLLIGKHNFESVKRIKKETSIDVPQDYVQDLAEGVLAPANATFTKWQKERRTFDVLKSAVECTEKKPAISDNIRKGIYVYFNRAEIIITRDMDDCDALFGLYTDSTLSPEIQAALLDRGSIDLFERLYQRSLTKIDEVRIGNVYEVLDRVENEGVNNLEVICRAAIITGIAPNQTISSKVFSYLLKEREYSELQRLCERTGLSPSFNQETVDEILGKYARTGGFSDFGTIVRIARKAKNKVNPEYVHEVARKYIAMYGEYGGDLGEVIGQVDKLYQDLRLKPSNEVTSAKIEGLMNDFRRKFESAEKQYSKEGF